MKQSLLALLVLSACEVAEPPAKADIPEEDPALTALRDEGRALFFDRAGCHACHRVGDEGDQERGPNLGDVRSRTADPLAIYLVESILDPDRLVVEGYAKGVMKRPDQPPVSLTDDEVVALIAYLASDSPPDLDEARAAMPRVRAEREERRVADATNKRIAGLRLEQGDSRIGRRLTRWGSEWREGWMSLQFE